MVRVGISVEGVTEERFFKGTLYPYFAVKGISITPVSMGGNVSVDRVKSELERMGYNFDFISTFYDFYGFKRKNAEETKQSLENKIYSAVKTELKGKLIPYIQMYEMEGLLFSSPESIAEEFQDEALADWANTILNQFSNNPEKINNSTETAPSKRLENHILRYIKTTHSPNISKNIGIEKLRQSCMGFNDFGG